MITYDPVGPEHYVFLYELLEERPKNANISHQKMPTFRQHVAYVDSWPSRFRQWHIIRYRGKLAGSVYLTHHNEFGMFIKKGFQRKGIASTTFRWIQQAHKGERLLSNVSPRNKRIIRVLERLGCRLVQYTYEHRS